MNTCGECKWLSKTNELRIYVCNRYPPTPTVMITNDGPVNLTVKPQLPEDAPACGEFKVKPSLVKS